MSRNEERANEVWEADVRQLLDLIRAACDGIQARVRSTRDCGEYIDLAVQDIDAATEALFKIRHGPERPE